MRDDYLIGQVFFFIAMFLLFFAFSISGDTSDPMRGTYLLCIIELTLGVGVFFVLNSPLFNPPGKDEFIMGMVFLLFTTGWTVFVIGEIFFTDYVLTYKDGLAFICTWILFVLLSVPFVYNYINRDKRPKKLIARQKSSINWVDIIRTRMGIAYFLIIIGIITIVWGINVYFQDIPELLRYNGILISLIGGLAIFAGYMFYKKIMVVKSRYYIEFYLGNIDNDFIKSHIKEIYRIINKILADLNLDYKRIRGKKFLFVINGKIRYIIKNGYYLDIGYGGRDTNVILQLLLGPISKMNKKGSAIIRKKTIRQMIKLIDKWNY